MGELGQRWHPMNRHRTERLALIKRMGVLFVAGMADAEAGHPIPPYVAKLTGDEHRIYSLGRARASELLVRLTLAQAQTVLDRAPVPTEARHVWPPVAEFAR
jgi:hypothetical protein